MRYPSFRLLMILILSGCTAFHPETTIPPQLAPSEQEKFQQDLAECRDFAESNRHKISFKDDVLWPLVVFGLFTAVGALVEYPGRIPAEAGHHPQSQHDGKALLGFSLAGLVVASGMVMKEMISWQHIEDADLRGCLYRRGYPVFD